MHAPSSLGGFKFRLGRSRDRREESRLTGVGFLGKSLNCTAPPRALKLTWLALLLLLLLLLLRHVKATCIYIIINNMIALSRKRPGEISRRARDAAVSVCND